MSEALSMLHLRAARERAAATGRRIIDELLGSDDGNTHLLAQLAVQVGMPAIESKALDKLIPRFDLISFTDAVRRHCLIASSEDGTLSVVIADPFDVELHTWISSTTDNEPLEWRLAFRADISSYLSKHEESLRALGPGNKSELPQNERDVQVDKLDFATIHEHASPVVKFVQSTIYDAMKTGASDIHLERYQSELVVKYRLDGVLVKIASADGVDFAEQVVSRIKVMSELDIAERRVPQDGRFRLRYHEREIDYRVSVMPSMVGEDIVIRILDKSALADQVAGLTLERLGFDPATLIQVRRLSRRPYGMFLVTGPTGSGKTTTMYAALSEVNDGQDKIVTIEDPVEYQLPGVLQIPVNERKGLTFARGLRSILRHDPDKILVGEIRDPETAHIAVQSALTGHLVYTSVHANNVFDVLGRFIHMGVDTYSFVAALNGILAQRLLRLVCERCAESYVPDEAEITDAGLSPSQISSSIFRKGQGCGHCRGTGFKGRHAVGEVLVVTDELRQMIVARAPIAEIKATAHANGLRYLREAALDLAIAGRTTLLEVNRVTFAS